MSTANGDEEPVLRELEVDVRAELTLAEHSRREFDVPLEELLFDPTEAERYEVGLRGLLGAAHALEDDGQRKS